MARVDLRQFNYQKIGELDADMWQAYYNHQFLKLFWQLLRLMHEQVQQSWFVTLRLAFYSAWAAADYRIHRKQVNRQRVLRNITNFYRLVSGSATEPFDYKRTADLELVWWDVHRHSKANNQALEDALAAAAASMYNSADPKDFMQYAHYRAEAMILPHHQGDGASNVTDWHHVKGLTIKSWKALYDAVQSQNN